MLVKTALIYSTGWPLNWKCNTDMRSYNYKEGAENSVDLIEVSKALFLLFLLSIRLLSGVVQHYFICKLKEQSRTWSSVVRGSRAQFEFGVLIEFFYIIFIILLKNIIATLQNHRISAWK